MPVGEVSGAEPPNSADDRVGMGHRDVAVLHAGRVRHGWSMGETARRRPTATAPVCRDPRACVGFGSGRSRKIWWALTAAAISRGAPSVSKRTSFGVS